MERIPTVFTGMSKHNFYLKDSITNFVLKEGKVPLNPYRLFGYFMGDAIERDYIKRGSYNLLMASDELWIFGVIANGNITEIEIAMRENKPIRFYTVDEHGFIYKEITSMDNLKFEPDVLPKLPYFDYRKRVEDYLKLHHRNNIGIEIERKWLIDKVPEELPLLSIGTVEQLYFSGEADVRIRRMETDDSTMCYLDIKGDGGLKRTEIKKEISIDEYNRIKEIIGKRPIEKIYYRYDVGLKHVLEVSVVDNGTEGSFIYAEIEFDSADEAETYVLPISNAVDVTHDPNYKMKNIWKKTRL